MHFAFARFKMTRYGNLNLDGILPSLAGGDPTCLPSRVAYLKSCYQDLKGMPFKNTELASSEVQNIPQTPSPSPSLSLKFA
jgi:hypothetical protein